MTSLEITNGRVDITDPCYDRDTWCALWDVPVKNGTYDITVGKTDEGRIAYIMMDLGEVSATFKKIGMAGVDAGLCGFFVDKPNFDDDWNKICESLFKQEAEKKDIYEIPSGVCSCSGWGDGEYPVIAYYNKDNEIVAIEVRFIEDEEEYEEEEE